MDKNNEKLVFESDSVNVDDLEKEDILNHKLTQEKLQKDLDEKLNGTGVPMSNGENCGIVEFEGKRINTCDGEQIVDQGYDSPDR